LAIAKDYSSFLVFTILGLPRTRRSKKTLMMGLKRIAERHGIYKIRLKWLDPILEMALRLATLEPDSNLAGVKPSLP
jgi:hypothetical protein